MYMCIFIATQGDVSFDANGGRIGMIRYFQYQSEYLMSMLVV